MIPTNLLPFWQAFQATLASDASSRFYEAFYFADSKPVANKLAALVLAGTKHATASLLWGYEAENSALPQPGQLSIMTNWQGTPLAVIETRRVDIVPFDEVSAEFAATEGEGDKSLDYWRKAHWAFFSSECEAIGKQADLRMLVVCEEFEVVYSTGNQHKNACQLLA